MHNGFVAGLSPPPMTCESAFSHKMTLLLEESARVSTSDAVSNSSGKSLQIDCPSIKNNNTLIDKSKDLSIL